MKNIYSILTGLLILFSLHLAGQTRIYAPDLRAPENQETGVSPDVLLDWDAVTGGTTDITYEVQLARSEDFSDAVTFPVQSVTSLQMSELLFGTTYYWHVRAFDSGTPSDWSETWSFTVLSSVDLDKPADGAMVYPDPTITFAPVTGLTGYQLEVDTTYLWSGESSGTTSDLNGSFIVDANDKWIVGDGGFVAHFDGTGWNVMDAGTSSNLNGVWFAAANDGWFVGSGGTILHYDGTAFTPVDGGTTKELFDVCFTDSNTGWAVGKSGTILMYDGSAWTSQTAPQTQDIYTVFALSANNVFAGAKKGYIFNYNGTDWSDIQLSGKKDVFGLWFKDAGNGWAVCKSGKIFYFDGTDWTQQPSGITKDLYGVSFNDVTGFAVGKNGYMLRYNNGAWEQVASGTGAYLNDVFLSGDEGIVVGNDGTLLKKAGEGFSSPYTRVYEVNKDSDNIQLANLLFGKTFYYRIRAVHSLDTSDWSVVKSMTTYAKPELDAPSNNASEQPLYLTFSWQDFSGVIKYTIETSETEDFAFALTSFSDSNSINIDNFGFNKTYYWRVNAIHAEDVSDWSDVFTFTTTNTVVLTSPENGAEGVNKSPRFDWEAIDGAGEYQIVVSQDESFTDPKENITDKPYFQCQSTLGYNQQYYWKVRAIAALDTSGWSPVWHFTTESAEGIEDVKGLSALRMFPNPSDGQFTVDVSTFKAQTYQISITDVTGKLIYGTALDAQAGSNKVNFSLDLGKGIYLLTISDGENSAVRKLFIK